MPSALVMYTGKRFVAFDGCHLCCIISWLVPKLTQLSFCMQLDILNHTKHVQPLLVDGKIRCSFVQFAYSASYQDYDSCAIFGGVPVLYGV